MKRKGKNGPKSQDVSPWRLNSGQPRPDLDQGNCTQVLYEMGLLGDVQDGLKRGAAPQLGEVTGGTHHQGEAVVVTEAER